MSGKITFFITSFLFTAYYSVHSLRKNNEKILYSLGSDYYNKCPREKIHVLNAACLENELVQTFEKYLLLVFFNQLKIISNNVSQNNISTIS